jgi:hypothetical protein
VGLQGTGGAGEVRSRKLCTGCRREQFGERTVLAANSQSHPIFLRTPLNSIRDTWASAPHCRGEEERKRRIGEMEETK